MPALRARAGALRCGWWRGWASKKAQSLVPLNPHGPSIVPTGPTARWLIVTAGVHAGWAWRRSAAKWLARASEPLTAVCNRGSSGLFPSSSWRLLFTPGLTAAFAPYSPRSPASASAWRGSASHPTRPSHQRMMRVMHEPPLASVGPGPGRGDIVISYVLATCASGYSGANLPPCEVEPPP